MPTLSVNNWCPTNCPVDCDDTLIVVPDFGCEAPNNDAITEIFYSNTSLVSGLLSEWNTRLSNSAADTVGIIRSLAVAAGASLPRVEATFKTTKLGSAMPVKTEKIITFIIEDDKDSSFAFFSKFQCGMTKKFWFRSGGHIYGGLQGISGTLISNYEINPDADGAAHNWQMQVRFLSSCFPDRTTAVI